MKARWTAVAAAAALASLPATAAPKHRVIWPDCQQTARTSEEMTECAAVAAQRADLRLNKAYADVLRYLDPQERAQLVAAQQAWLRFRDFDCVFWSGGGGTIASTNKQYCLAERSNERAGELEKWPPNSNRSALVPLKDRK